MINSKKENEIVIEKNVPVKQSRYYSKWGKITDEMEIGDSIVLIDRKLVNLFCNHGYRRGMKFTVRKQDEGFRIWRKE